MKRLISTLLVCVLLVSCVFTLASCGATLSGEYKDALSVTTYKFSGSKVTLTIDNLIGEDSVFEGTYSIEGKDDDKKITITFEDKDGADKYSGTHDFSEGEEDGKEYIKIGIIKYYKQ